MTKKSNKNIKYFKILVPLSLTLSLAAYFLISHSFGAPDKAKAFLVGALLSLINLFTLAYVLKTLFEQKSFAWATVLIVSKYPILGLIIYFVTTQTWFDVFYFCAGLSSIICLALVIAMIENLKVRS